MRISSSSQRGFFSNLIDYPTRLCQRVRRLFRNDDILIQVSLKERKHLLERQQLQVQFTEEDQTAIINKLIKEKEPDHHDFPEKEPDHYQIPEKEHDHHDKQYKIKQTNRKLKRTKMAKKIAKEVYFKMRQELSKYADILDIFSTLAIIYESSITKESLLDLLEDLDCQPQDMRRLFVNDLFELRQTLSLKKLLQKLDLDQLVKKEEQIRRQRKLQKQQAQLELDKIAEEKHFSVENTNIQEEQAEEMESVNYLWKPKYSEEQEIFLQGKLKSTGTEYIKHQDIPKRINEYFINHEKVLDPIFVNISEGHLQNEVIFNDPYNPPYSKAFRRMHLASEFNRYQLFQAAHLSKSRNHKRDKISEDEVELLSVKDIKQGDIGDCYFLSGLVGIAERYPQLIYRLFLLQRNPSHLFGVCLFVEGKWKTITLDGSFPTNRQGQFCGAKVLNRQIWVILLEKAWAKIFGSYDIIDGGKGYEGLTALSGAPWMVVITQKPQWLLRAKVELNIGSIITCGTSQKIRQMTQQQQLRLGIFQNHGYTLLDIFLGVQTFSGKVILLKVRNPHGSKEWQGDWSFNSSLWTQQLRQKFNFEHHPRDGSFFINLQDFMSLFTTVFISRIIPTNVNSWLQIQSHELQFKTVRAVIKEKGDYYFTIYQEDERRYRGTPYTKSKSWMFLVQEKGGRYLAIRSSSLQYFDNSIQAHLDPGEYLFALKVEWKLWHKHHYTLCSYGPEKVIFDEVDKWSPSILTDFIDCKIKLNLIGLEYTKVAQNKKIVSKRFFNRVQGYGFVTYENNEEDALDMSVNFKRNEDIVILPPHELPLNVKVMPGEKLILKFLVDPFEHSYEIRETFDINIQL